MGESAGKSWTALRDNQDSRAARADIRPARQNQFLCSGVARSFAECVKQPREMELPF